MELFKFALTIIQNWVGVLNLHSLLQLSEAQESVAGLQEEVSSLTAQLNEAHEKQNSLSAALDSTRETMEMYHTTARQVGCSIPLLIAMNTYVVNLLS